METTLALNMKSIACNSCSVFASNKSSFLPLRYFGKFIIFHVELESESEHSLNFHLIHSSILHGKALSPSAKFCG
ncbi:CLUMA_CG010624, isoform A [Clunio marinus]|uniref:CLUMA_CG010624, isoform A n=1 Tax=Clunio marinus TaxID=568069 RepID=A0A1J1ICF0_9DIPT|nr:CLUMA_CG010624, isoform A [Clunio marinus]